MNASSSEYSSASNGTFQKASHITPALLVKSFDELESGIKLVSKKVTLVQIDVVDGVFVQNKTWPFVGDGHGNFAKIVKQEVGLPDWEECEFEIDLMVSKPAFEADKWIAAGASYIVVHLRSVTIGEYEEIGKAIQDKGVKLVLGLAADVTLEEAASYMDKVMPEGVQCMGIKHIGFQGQKFDETVADRIKAIRAKYPDVEISVDGGMGNVDAVALVRDAGANRVIAGSAVFGSGRPIDTIAEFEEVMTEGK